MAIWNVVYCLRMCMLDNKLQTFFNLVLFQQLCGREVLWNWFYVFAACERLESMFVENVMFIFQQQLHGRFSLKFGWLYFRNLMLQHGARQQDKSKTARYSGWQIAGQLTLVVFVCWEKGVRARSSHGIWVWFACVFLQALSASPVLHGPQA